WIDYHQKELNEWRYLAARLNLPLPSDSLRSSEARAFRRVVSPFQTDPTLNPLGLLPGDPLQGGYFAGYISHTNNGVPTHALIVAPKASGESASLQWKTSNTSTFGTSSDFDGAANTAAMDNASHPAAQYCAGLTIGGYSDWYLPARCELDIAYFHLKPTTGSNNTSWGVNDYSVPKRTANYTAGDPARTSIAAFQDGGAEAFVADTHWSSTEDSATLAWGLTFFNGLQLDDSGKNSSVRVRAFRKFAL
ncbi:MAG: hypothetical protein RL614_674, partial [Pseudomonadota bacterium]